MNANELADEIMEHYKAELPRGFNVNWMQEAATMLRQQEVEIESLKATVARLTIEGGKEIKPVKYSAEWWKEVEEFNKQLRTHKK